MPHENPFNVRVLARGAGFTDRTTEVARMVRAFEEPGGALVVYGERRLGKSSALEAAAHKVRAAKLPVAIVDWSTASGPSDAANRLLAAVDAAVGRSWRAWWDGLLRSLSLGVSLTPPSDPVGMPTVGLQLGRQERHGPPTRLITEVLDAIEQELRRRNVRLGLGIDEFQRLHEWGGEDAEWALKGSIERHEHISYVLAGSARSLIEGMVTSKKRALWKVVDTLYFGPIASDTLARWIYTRARATGVDIPRMSAMAIAVLAGPRTRDVVYLAREVWQTHQDGGRVTVPHVHICMDAVVADQSVLYERTWSLLKPPQQNLLRALAAEPGVALGADDTRRRYDLGPKSTVHEQARMLAEAELLVPLGKGGYGFDDPLFKRWVQCHTLPDIGVPVPALADWASGA